MCLYSRKVLTHNVNEVYMGVTSGITSMTETSFDILFFKLKKYYYLVVKMISMLTPFAFQIFFYAGRVCRFVKIWMLSAMISLYN